MKSRKQLIDEGLICQVYPEDNTMKVLFEGTEAECRAYVKDNCQKEYEEREVRIGKVIFEYNINNR